MRSKNRILLSTSMIPLIVLGGVSAGGLAVTGILSALPARAACSPCNPCAAANPCNPCNPCAAGGGGSVAACAVPRLQTAAANPCAVAKPVNPCSPCAAAKPCNPCAAANPCNPCAAANPCNPCAAANPCNPCAAANPCNPCAAANPCNPCGAGATPELTDAEAVEVYDCLFPTMTAAYAKSAKGDASGYSNWRRYSTRAYVSATHGSRYVQNYANASAKAYGAYEQAGTFPVGAKLAKDSFMLNANGEVSVGPLFMMEKMPAGFNPDSDDWRYTMVMPNGAIAGTTNGEGSANVEFCIGCHIAVAPEQDSVMLLPEDYRVK